MSHPFGDRVSQHLHRKHGLSQSKLAAGILQVPTVISDMCKGRRLTGPQARERVIAIIDWLHQQGTLDTLDEANALLNIAGMSPLSQRQLTDAALLQSLCPPGVPQPAVNSRRRVPVPPTPLIGRDRDAAAVRERLLHPDVRLLTLLGPPGVGKTRLSLHVASEVSDAFADNACFVALAPIADPNFVVPAIAQALDVIAIASLPLIESLKHALSDRHLLLVLDNFEQVLDAAPMVADLLAAAPHLKVLVTSREVLHISGEHEYHVPPLALPNVRHLPALDALKRVAAVTLFVQRTRAAKPDFNLSEASAPTVAAICHRLDGVPLAIELAAPRLKLFSPQALLERLAESPLDTLTDGASDLPPRQRLLRNTIEWSYRLLEVDEQVVFRRLGVFAGGFTLVAAEAVSGASWAAISSLLDKSLIQPSPLASNGLPANEARFSLLEMLREYALERLTDSGEMEAIQRRHAEHYLELAGQIEPKLSSTMVAEWLNRLEAERDNMRAALAWSLKSDDTLLGLRLAAAFTYVLLERWPPSESRTWLVAILARPQQGSAEHRAIRAKLLCTLGNVVGGAGRIAEADTSFQESLMLYQALGDKHGIATVTRFLGDQGWTSQDPARRTYYEESLAIFRELRDQEGIAQVLSGLGALAWSQGDFARATTRWEENLNLRHRLGDQGGIAEALFSLGTLARYQGDYVRATRLLDDGLALARKVQDKGRIVVALINLGWVALAQNACSRAATLLEESLSLARELEIANWIAWSLQSLATAAWLQGDDAQATALYWESLRLNRDTGDKWGMSNCLDGFSWVACRQGNLAQDILPAQDMRDAMRGARLLGAVAALREITGNPRSVAEIAWIELAEAHARVALGEVAFAAAWAEGRAMTLEQAVAYALKDGLTTDYFSQLG